MNFNFGKLLKDSSSISVIIENQTQNFDEKFMIFLKSHGNRVKELVFYDQPKSLTNFLHFLPNLQTLSIKITKQFESDQNCQNFEKQSIQLKALKIYNRTGNANFLKELEIFDMEELHLIDDGYYRTLNNVQKDENLVKNYADFISNLKNLRNFVGFHYEEELLDVLAQKNLESLRIRSGNISEDKIIDFLKEQKSLKSLYYWRPTKKILNAICENLYNLEYFGFVYCESDREINKENVMKISNLKSLKSLDLAHYGDHSCLTKDYCTFQLPNLESLSINTPCKFSIETMVSSTKLKSLLLGKSGPENLQINPSDIFKLFKNLEVFALLSMRDYRFDEILDDITFDKNNSSNINSLVVNTQNIFYIENSLPKLTNNFPSFYDIHRSFESGHIRSNIYRHIKFFFNSPKFNLSMINLNSVENGNQELKDLSCDFNRNIFGLSNGLVKTVNDGRKHISFNIKEVKI